MVRSACGSLIAVFLITSSALAQTMESCGVRAIEIEVWRGSQGGGERASVPEQICSLGAAADELQASDPLVPAEWGIPNLDEITELVLASPQLSSSQAQSLAGSTPPVFGSRISGSALPALTSSAVRTVIVTPSPSGGADQILHLMIYEANPNRLELDVHSGVERPIRLSWTRSAYSPQWAPGARRAL